MGSKRENVMLSYQADEKKLSKMPEVVIFQRKLNGERARLEWDSTGNPHLFSSCNNEFPFFTGLKEELISNQFQEINFDGELYLHGLSREETHSIASRRVNSHPDEEKLSIHIFDIIDQQPQIKRIRLLNSLNFKNCHFLKKVESTITKKENLIPLADQYIKEGFEGIMIRHPHAIYVPRKCNYLLKFKPSEVDIYPIIGYQEEIDIAGFAKGRLGSVIVQDTDGHSFAVGTGNALDAAGREYWWLPENKSRLTSCSATVKHSAIMTVKGLPTCTSLISIEITPTITLPEQCQCLT